MHACRGDVFTSIRFWDRGRGALALAYLGMKLGENWRELGKYFHKFDAVIGVMLVAGVAWFVWSHWQNRMRTES